MKKLLCIILISISYAMANPVLEEQCQQSDPCVIEELSGGLTSTDSLNQVAKSLQESVWITEKMAQLMNEDSKKEKFLLDTKIAFKAAQAGYPGKAADEGFLKTVETYQDQYEKLFDATKAESMLQAALNQCYGAAGLRCDLDRMDDLKVKYTEAQSKKLAILMSFPLLSTESVRDSIEDEIDLMNNYHKGKISGYKDATEFNQSRKVARRQAFNNVMLEGLDETSKALKDRRSRWSELFGKNLSTLEYEPHVAHKKIEKLQKNNTQIVSELLNNIDEKELVTSYSGSPVCSIYQRNKESIAIEERNKMILDGALMVAPFFLGPIGGAARLATLSRFAGWGVKGRVFVAAGVEGSLLAKDLVDLSNTADRCQDMSLSLIRPDESFSTVSGIESVNSCQDELQNEIMMTVAGGTLAPIAFLHTGTKASKLSAKSLNIIDKFKNGRSDKNLRAFLQNEKLPAEDIEALEAQFKAFKKESGLSGDEAVNEFKLKYKKLYDDDLC